MLSLAGSRSAVAQPADPAIAYVPISGSNSQKLVVMNADGSNAAAIYTPPTGASVVDPTWSPTGTQIAFNQNTSLPSGGLWRLDVAVVNGKPRGLNPTQLVAVPPGGALAGWGPAWSPAGDRIAFYAVSETWVYTIQTVPASGGAPTVVYTGLLWLNTPTWSPDATRIAFLEHDPAFDSAFRLRVLDLATGVATTVLPGDFSAQFCGGSGCGYKGLEWARTGDVLAFSVGGPGSGNPSHPDGDAAIYLLDLAGGPPVLASESGVQPTWSPDDSSIVYSDIEDGRKLRRINLSTGLVTTFRNKSGRDPAWRPF
jgi:Tol biopolymer transport system component